MKTIEQLEAEAKKARQEADDAGGTDLNLNKLAEDAEKVFADAKKEEEDFRKQREIEEGKNPPQSRTEEEKAEYTIKQILGRHPELKDKIFPGGQPVVTEGEAKNIEQKLLRNQVEGIFRSQSASEEEVKTKLFYYDNKIVKTGNIHEDADNATWLANKGRTRNAIDELKRKPADPGAGAGAGTPQSGDGSVPNLSPDDIRKLTLAGMKQISAIKWEGEKTILEWDVNSKQWKETRK